MTVRRGNLETLESVRGNISYSLELWHDGLKKHRLIRGSDSAIIRRKADIQTAEWEQKWAEIRNRDQNRQAKEDKRRFAAEQTAEAQGELNRLATILTHTLQVNDAIDWERLKDSSEFTEPLPHFKSPPPKPEYKLRPREPQWETASYAPELGLFGRLFTKRRERIIAAMRLKYAKDLETWNFEAKAIDLENAAALKAHEEKVVAWNRERTDERDAWKARETEFLTKQRLRNEAVERQRLAYCEGLTDAICDYCDMVLSASEYPTYFPKEFDLDYVAESKVLVVDYSLPAPDDIPKVREVKFVSARNELVEQTLSQSQLDKLYDDLLYQIALRTLHELFEADGIDALHAITFNGMVTSIDKSTGKSLTACVLSIQAPKNQFMAINLASVDPKACFKALKGVGSSKLHSLAAIAPILKMRRDDGRFVSAREMTNTLDESSNLASMDWEDFEHLIREVFEQEFSSAGGEVKVTRTSRDGGVDAVAFDPDPIRGGKIVIQAKRYTNTVSVAAVRDLYGTIMNEGANKGIWVTTSDYGPDAYEFAKGKPIVLMNGANLLHMLSKHGHSAKIDIEKARRLA